MGMRVFSQGQLAQGCARVLMAAFLWSALCSGIAVVPAGAQVTTRSVADTSVAVVPFHNQSGYRPDTFGEEVASMVAADLEQRLSLDVLPAGEVALEMKNLGLQTPLDTTGLTRLATNLEVKMLVWGEVRGAKIISGNGDRRAEVVLAVRLFDRFAQADTNGALVTAYSPAQSGASDEEAIGLALKQAVFDAVTQMKTRPTVTARVIWAKADRIFTNTGTRGGVTEGMKMVAVRDNERIALVEIFNATGTGADGRVLSGSQLRTGDQLRAIYDLPGTGAPPTLKQSLKRKSKAFETPLLLAGILIGVSGLAQQSRSLNTGSETAPNFHASGLANGVELTAGGIVAAFPLETVTNLVTWSVPSSTVKRRVAAYIITRSGQVVDMVVPAFGDQPRVFDSYTTPQGMVGCDYNSQAIVLDAATGDISPGGWSHDFWDGTQTYSEWFSGHDPIGIVIGPQDFNLGWFPNPAEPNVRVFYQIRPIIIVDTSTTGTPTWEFSMDTDPTPPGDEVTSVVPPAIDQAFLLKNSLATFVFYHPAGADEMILQVQREQSDGRVDFATGPQTLSRVITGLNPGIAPAPFVFDQRNLQVDISVLRALTGTSDVYWWRVGARNRNDTVLPRPWPSNTATQFDKGWVWSWPAERVQFSADAAGRTAAAHEERDTLKASLLSRRTTRVRDSARPMHVPEH